ncbi:PPE family protein [Mycobacterium tuberculosis]|nr:PPE family protein [Mycobacterium tuberculosis]CNN20484.1 PPE family protein [Mycobacterium tuberculosis]CNN24250.1 PPE family protein [Mycobacterium tuberculosis]CNN54384.1 PPE family protein [Mycobacterium tuberculosis]
MSLYRATPDVPGSQRQLPDPTHPPDNNTGIFVTGVMSSGFFNFGTGNSGLLVSGNGLSGFFKNLFG